MSRQAGQRRPWIERTLFGTPFRVAVFLTVLTLANLVKLVWAVEDGKSLKAVVTGFGILLSTAGAVLFWRIHRRDHRAS